ncbi:MAG TPA: biopolymer transporter ExbD [Steroidobacteraceae bacterium]|jgi:biopolymer transport protein ExbD|nr:biopolymer transporter ExbD [Steroidobacteraceae bacterium]
MAFSTNQEDDSVLSEINITPLVDVMLVLLVAFVITIPALTNAIHVNLPKTVTTTPPEQQKAITVTVDVDGKVYLDNREIARESLQQELSALKTANNEVSLHLRADDRVPYGPVAKVMAAIEHAGITKVSVLTDTTS